MSAHAATCICQQPIEPLPVFVPTVEAMADAMRNHNWNCTEDTLSALGFPLSFQRTYKDAAVALANKGFVAETDAAGEDEDTIVAQMRAVVGEILPSLRDVLTGLRYKGFSERQINLYTRRVINLASKDFVAITLPRAAAGRSHGQAGVQG